jgi:hypothetical protein
MAATVAPPAVIAPHSAGTFTINTLGAWYTIGRDFAPDMALKLAGQCPYLGCDIETAGLGAASMFVKAVTFSSTDHAVVLDPRDPLQADAISQVFDRLAAVVFHNSPYDVPILVRNGLMPLAAISTVWDTLLYARMAEPDERTRKSLATCSARYLGTDPANMLEQAMKALGMSRVDGYKAFDLDRPIYVHGAAIDGIVTARLAPLTRAAAMDRITFGHPFKAPLGVSGAEARRLVDREQRINRMFLRRSARGLRVDLDFLDRYREQVGQEQTADRGVLAEEGIREGRAEDLTEWLHERGLLPDGYPVTPTGKLSGQAKHLERLKHPLALAFVRLKQSEKVAKDYLVKIVDLADEQDRVHPQTAILGATTGRMAMGDPPLHQFPEGARGIILADEGDELTSIDWSAIEPVVAANVARETAVIDLYEAGGDFYEVVAEMAGGIARKQAKVVLLAQMYGEGMPKLAADLDISVDDAWGLRNQIFRSVPRLDRTLRRLREIGREHRLISTMSGRIVPVPVGTYDGQVSVQAHKAVNYFVQGSAYDVLAETLVAVDDAGLSDAVYLAMHDELVVSTSAAADVQKIMETPPPRLCELSGRTPVLRTDRADLGERWAAA